MYRKLLASTALTLVIAGGAYAQETLPADPMAPADPLVEAPATPEVPLVTAADIGINADGWLATEIIGETIYNSTTDDAEAIGDVNDFVLGPDGQIGAVVVGVGGFLGLGQHNVAINWEELQLVTDVDGNNRLVATLSREQLEAAPAFNREEWLASERAVMTDPAIGDPLVTDTVPADPLVTETDPVVVDPAPADPLVEEPLATDPAPVVVDPAPVAVDPAAPGLAWESYEVVAIGDISADELTGTTVYGAGDENIGSIGDLILSEDGTVEAVIVDFGGFLGLGTKPVAVDFESLNVLRDEGGSFVVRTTLTEAALDAAPEYDPDAYVLDREQYIVYSN